MVNLKCPICKTATSLAPVHYHTKAIIDEDDDKDIHFQDVIVDIITENYAIVQCNACEEIFVAKKVGYQDWEGVYPISHSKVPEQVPESIRNYFNEANLCFAVEAYVATVTMCQVALESVWREKNCSGLNDLKGKGIISEQLFNQATEIRLWAGITKHKLYTGKISKEDAEQLLMYLESILDAVFVQPARMAEMAKKREDLKKTNKIQ